MSEIETKAVRVPTMTDADRAEVLDLFDASYEQANHAYLLRSIDRIGLLVIGFLNGRPCGFDVANCRWMDLPGFEETQLVVLHGMRCVSPDFRHRGISTHLSHAVGNEMFKGTKRRAPERYLVCGRHGHASGTDRNGDAGSVPRPGRTPSRWQQGVGLAVAEAFGSILDPTTFVCIGSGTPIGYPNEDFESSDADQRLWAPVDRDRGDNLLVIHWSPDSPPGWIEVE